MFHRHQFFRRREEGFYGMKCVRCGRVDGSNWRELMGRLSAPEPDAAEPYDGPEVDDLIPSPYEDADLAPEPSGDIRDYID